MNILMVTNTYLPMVGGVARSVASFTEEFRRQGHRVLVVAPTYEGLPEQEEGVLRVPAIQHFNGSDFSVRLPVPVALSSVIDTFAPDIVHSHHPFLLGDTALRIATLRDLPIVFTHHTMYEQYTHYVPVGATALKGFVSRLATEYANLCDHVIAPSESIAAVLRERGVTTPITVVPTGIDPKRFARGSGRAARRRYGVPPAAFVVGHVGRLAPEKNLGFLARAVAAFVAADERACFLVVGSGPSQDEIRSAFAERGLADRLFLTGPLEGKELADAYHAMNVFAFASQTETQGMVVAEAMTAGVPVVAVDAPGVREVVRDGRNGRLLSGEDEAAFAAALRWVADVPPAKYRALVRAARDTAKEFALERCARRVLDVYSRLLKEQRRPRPEDDNPWTQTLRLVEAEWNLWGARVGAAVKALVNACL
ncbi:MAG TPA: glycosyltransferase [Gemmataceae bacterium]|nr:glycosyltransferase [Gemmataceae bacterium]